MTDRAFVVAIETYARLGDNEGAIAAGEQFRDFLVGQYGFAHESIVQARPHETSGARLRAKISGWATSLHSGDRGVLYFLGHGDRIVQNGDLVSVLCASDYDEGDPSTYLTNSDMENLLGVIPPGCACAFVCDACKAGGIVKHVSVILRRVLRRLRGSVAPARDVSIELGSGNLNLSFLASGGAPDDAAYLPKSYEPSRGWFGGLFTHCLTQELGTPGGQAESLDRLIQSVAANVNRESPDQTPRLGGRPDLKGKPFLSA